MVESVAAKFPVCTPTVLPVRLPTKLAVTVVAYTFLHLEAVVPRSYIFVFAGVIPVSLNTATSDGVDPFEILTVIVSPS